jgi:enoyl-CoA hydratase/carnithine racemase
MTSAMYVALARVFNEAAHDETCRSSFGTAREIRSARATNIEKYFKNPPRPGESPRAGLMNALVNFDKPLVAAVHGAAIRGGTTMLMHCDFI